ncbi:DUF3099 domain-containing protein [Streptomyces cocklensis]|nr:DUF3099 domain-containing protein [Actinacidiphila cocklensis]MDD1061652.1 DUF3099 domain-containing protein [Actinacidiphila cocklensis]WSX77690.1 DUF3099 domain-containing protein [Streptomyces sp. NBC_00899]
MNAHRRHWYYAMMGTCVVLFVMAWAVVRLWSVQAAIGMCLVAMVIPPVAAIIANRHGPNERWFDEPQDDDRGSDAGTGDPESDAWWDELEGRKGKDHRR